MNSSSWTDHFVGPASLLRNFTLEAILHGRSRSNFPVKQVQHVLFFNCVEQICGLYNVWGSKVPVPDELKTVMPNYFSMVRNSTKFNLKVHIGIICYLCTRAIKEEKAANEGEEVDKRRTAGIQLVGGFAKSVLSMMTISDSGRPEHVKKRESSLVTPMFGLRSPPQGSNMPAEGLSLAALSEFLIEKIMGKEPEWKIFFAAVDESIVDFDTRMATVALAPKHFEDVLGDKGACAFPEKKSKKRKNDKPGNEQEECEEDEDEETKETLSTMSPGSGGGDHNEHSSTDESSRSSPESGIKKTSRELFKGTEEEIVNTRSLIDEVATRLAMSRINTDTDTDGEKRVKKSIAAKFRKALESAMAEFDNDAASNSAGKNGLQTALVVMPEELSTSYPEHSADRNMAQEASRMKGDDTAAGFGRSPPAATTDTEDTSEHKLGHGMPKGPVTNSGGGSAGIAGVPAAATTNAQGTITPQLKQCAASNSAGKNGFETAPVITPEEPSTSYPEHSADRNMAQEASRIKGDDTAAGFGRSPPAATTDTEDTSEHKLGHGMPKGPVTNSGGGSAGIAGVPAAATTNAEGTITPHLKEDTAAATTDAEGTTAPQPHVDTAAKSGAESSTPKRKRSKKPGKTPGKKRRKNGNETPSRTFAAVAHRVNSPRRVEDNR
jgi:hypothetical protein